MRRFLNLDRFRAALSCGLLPVLLTSGVALAQTAPASKPPPTRQTPARGEDLEKRKEELVKQSEAAFGRQDFKVAETLIRTLIEIDGDNFVPWYNLACSLSMQGRTEDAGPALVPGMYYQFRATSIKAGIAISRTEDLRGVFYLPKP